MLAQTRSNTFAVKSAEPQDRDWRCSDGSFMNGNQKQNMADLNQAAARTRAEGTTENSVKTRSPPHPRRFAEGDYGGAVTVGAGGEERSGGLTGAPVNGYRCWRAMAISARSPMCTNSSV